MKRQLSQLLKGTAAVGAAIAIVMSPAMAEDNKISGTFAIATLPPGTTFNATAAAIASMFNDYSGARMRLREVGGSIETYVSRKETDFALNSGPMSFNAWTGTGTYKDNKMKNLRNIAIGPVLYGSLMVTEESGIKKVSDLKGHKIPARFNSMPTFLVDIDVVFAAGGIGWDDVQSVPVAGIRENYQAFMDGLTDAANTSVGAGVVSQAAAKHGGVRFVSLPGDGPEVAKKVADEARGYYPVTLPKGSYTGIVEDTTVWAKDILVNVHEEVSDEVVYQFAKIMWEHMRELDSSHPVMKTWTQEGFASDRNTVPRHPGAIKFLKEIGKWTEANDARQEELLGMK